MNLAVTWHGGIIPNARCFLSSCPSARMGGCTFFKVTVEFDCDVEGDGDDGWEDDLEDDSDLSLDSGEQQQPQGKGGEGQDDEGDEDDMIGPGKTPPVSR